MLKYLFFIASFFSITMSDTNLRKRELDVFLGDGDEWKQFSNFQERFSKRYDTLEELENRFQVFRLNLRNIILHNLDRSQNFTMGINQFTDLTPEEFKAQYVNLLVLLDVKPFLLLLLEHHHLLIGEQRVLLIL